MKNEQKDEQLRKLYKAFTLLKTDKEVENFLHDLCTPAELAAMAQRLRVAEMLTENCAYNKVEEETAASSATISRVSAFLKERTADGYKTVLNRLK